MKKSTWTTLSSMTHCSNEKAQSHLSFTIGENYTKLLWQRETTSGCLTFADFEWTLPHQSLPVEYNSSLDFVTFVTFEIYFCMYLG